MENVEIIGIILIFCGILYMFLQGMGKLSDKGGEIETKILTLKGGAGLILVALGITLFAIGGGAGGLNNVLSEMGIKSAPDDGETTRGASLMQDNISPMLTKTSVQSTPIADSKFRVGPTVVLRPKNDIINTSEDGRIELYVLNPSINNVTLNLNVFIHIPAEIHVYGSGFSMSGASGDINGIFSVPPGTSQNMSIYIRGEKKGSYTVNITGLYWPDENKDAYILISFSHPFIIK